MNFELSEEQLEFQASARKFAQLELMPEAAVWDEQQIFPKKALKKAGALGFMAMYVPESLGGIGLSRLDSAIIFEELATSCTSTAAYISIHNMATHIIAGYATEDIRQQWLASLSSGEKLASYCLTEPSSGSDAASLRTSAKKQGDQYILNGSKAFISGAGDTDVLVVMARTGESGPKGISAFAIPSNLKGIGFGKKEAKLGWNSQPTRAVTFDNVKVPEYCLLGTEGQGFTIAMQGLDGGRINIGICSVGAARFCLDTAISYTQERKQFNRPISSFQNTQFKLADMATKLTAARQMIFLAASKLDANAADKTMYCAMAKRLATDEGIHICDQALQLLGGYGVIKDYLIERYFRDTKVHQILEGTNEIMRLIIAKWLLKQPGKPTL